MIENLLILLFILIIVTLVVFSKNKDVLKWKFTTVTKDVDGKTSFGIVEMQKRLAPLVKDSVESVRVKKVFLSLYGEVIIGIGENSHLSSFVASIKHPFEENTEIKLITHGVLINSLFIAKGMIGEFEDAMDQPLFFTKGQKLELRISVKIGLIEKYHIPVFFEI